MGGAALSVSGLAHAQTLPPDRAELVAAAPTGQDASTLPADIVVTATKRAERVRDISGSVSAFDEKSLEALGAQSFSDYLTRTPGVVFNQTIPGNSAAIIRGVATTTQIAQAQGTTGYFIDDVPLTDPFYSAGIPDIDTFDVDNIAILRGPQGTLFGSASMGGAINYEAARPDLSGVEAHLRGTIADVDHGSTGYDANGMINLPIVDGVFGIRAVYGHRRIAGYIDNVGTGERNANRTEIDGGRLLATWKPTAGTTLNYLFLEQYSRTRDAGATDPDVGDYAKDTLVAEPFRYRTTIHNLRLDQDLGFATLTATATYHSKIFSSVQDYSGLAPDFAPVSFDEPGHSRGETFEARIASPSDRSFEYLIGIYADSTREFVEDKLIAPSAAPSLGSDTLIDAPTRIRGRESALFGEGTYHLDDQLKVTLGGRLFHTRLTTNITQSGPLVGATSTSSGGSRETGFSPKASITWQPSRQFMLYGLASRGFRFGGPNIAKDPVFDIPAQFKSDSLWNYEIGARSSTPDGKLELDATLYWIDWTNIQITQTSPSGFTYTDNAGRARNRGFEASVTYRPAHALTLQGAVTYLDGELRRDFASAGGTVAAGTMLPGASRWQISDSIAYAPQGWRFTPTFAISHRYVSKAPGELVPSPQRQGGYNLIDLRAGAKFGRFGLAAFIDNIADKRGVSNAVTSVHGPVQYIVQPRTIGLRFKQDF